MLYSKFNLSEVSRRWLSNRTVNAFSHCLKAAKFNPDEACNAYARMLHRSYSLSGCRFIMDDTMEKHSKLCRFIRGVSKHWNQVFHTTVSAKCTAFLYYRNGEKTENDLAIELIEQALGGGISPAWWCLATPGSVRNHL